MKRFMIRPLIGCLSSLCIGIVVLSGSAFAQTGRGAGVPPEALPKELRDLNPRDTFVSSNQKKAGVIHALEGKVVVIHKTSNEAFFGVEGDPIFENDSLNTLAESRCRVRILNEDVITMAPDTEFSVESCVDQREEGKKTSLFSMAKGRAMFYAMRLFGYKDTRFTLNTPTVTVGVRGTKFGAHVYFPGGEKKADNRGVLVADAGSEIAPYLAQTGPGGGQSFTDAFSEDGVLDVGGRIVPPGQMFNGQTGQVIPTPPSVLRSFQQATQMGPAPKGALPGRGEGGPGDGQPLGGTGQSSQQTFVDVQENILTTTQMQTGIKTEETNKPPTGIVPYTGTLYGYFAGLLQKGSLFQDAFLNYVSGYAPGLIDVANTACEVNGVINSSDWVDIGLGPNTASIGGISASGHSEEDHQGVVHFVGQNEYAQWGYWSSNTNHYFIVSGNNYYWAGDQVWGVQAKHITTATEIASVPKGDYNYAGVAYGNYYNGSITAQMSGGFSSKVNFGSASVKDFSLGVAGGGHSATIVWSGTQSITASSSSNNFVLSSPATSATIDGASVSYSKVSGSLVGPNAEGMIGAWGAASSTAGVGASGIFSSLIRIPQ